MATSLTIRVWPPNPAVPISLSFIKQIQWILPEHLLLWGPWSKNMSVFYFWSSLYFVVQGGRSTVEPYEDVTKIGTAWVTFSVIASERTQNQLHLHFSALTLWLINSSREDKLYRVFLFIYLCQLSKYLPGLK